MLLKGKNRLFRFTAFCTFVAFFNSNLFADAAATGSVKPTAVISPSFIPSELGSVEEIHNGTNGKTLIYIQDAHDSLEAQKNIAKIISHLVEKENVKTVLEEGYEGPVPTDRYFGFIKDPKIKEKISYFFMDHLRIGGAEYAHINRTKDFQLIGADSVNLQKENIEQYRKSSERKEQIDSDLSNLEKEIKSLADLYFPKEVKDWMKQKELFNQNQLPLLDYLRGSIKLLPADQGQVRPYSDIRTILEAEKGKDAAQLEKAKSINAKDLYTAIEQMEEAIAGRFLSKERDRKIFEYYSLIRLLKRLADLSISFSEYQAAKKNLEEVNTEQIGEFISREIKKTLILPKRWEKDIKESIGFYELAQQRDEAIAKHVKDFFDNSEEKMAILVFGGFHKDSVRTILKSYGTASHMIVTPKITEMSKRHEQYYHDLMTAGRLPFEPLSSIKTAVRAESSIEVWDSQPELARAELHILFEMAQQNDNSDFALNAERELKKLASEGRVEKGVRSEIRMSRDDLVRYLEQEPAVVTAGNIAEVDRVLDPYLNDADLSVYHLLITKRPDLITPAIHARVREALQKHYVNYFDLQITDTRMQRNPRRDDAREKTNARLALFSNFANLRLDLFDTGSIELLMNIANGLKPEETTAALAQPAAAAGNQDDRYKDSLFEYLAQMAEAIGRDPMGGFSLRREAESLMENPDIRSGSFFERTLVRLPESNARRLVYKMEGTGGAFFTFTIDSSRGERGLIIFGSARSTFYPARFLHLYPVMQVIFNAMEKLNRGAPGEATRAPGGFSIRRISFAPVAAPGQAPVPAPARPRLFPAMRDQARDVYIDDNSPSTSAGRIAAALISVPQHRAAVFARLMDGVKNMQPGALLAVKEGFPFLNTEEKAALRAYAPQGLSDLKKYIVNSEPRGRMGMRIKRVGVQGTVLKTLLEIFNSLAEEDEEFSKQLFDSFLEILVAAGLEKGEIDPDKDRLTQEHLWEAIVPIIQSDVNAVRNIYARYTQAQGDLRQRWLSMFLKAPEGFIALVLEVDVKLARYLKITNGQNIERLSDPETKRLFNELAYNVSREVTSHPAERRMDDDELTAFFQYFFGLNTFDFHWAKADFDEYYRNDPDAYEIPLDKVVELFTHLDLEQIRTLIRVVREDPKVSLADIKASVMEAVRTQQNAEFLQRRLDWILSNFFILEDKLDYVWPIAKSLKVHRKGTGELTEILNRLERSGSLPDINAIANEFQVRVTDLLALRIHSRFNTQDQMQMQSREDLIISALGQLDRAKMEIAEGTPKEAIYKVLWDAYETLPDFSRRRIYILSLMRNVRDNQILAQILTDFEAQTSAEKLTQHTSLAADSFSIRFLSDPEAKTIAVPFTAQGALPEYLEHLGKLSTGSRNGGFDLLRALFSKRDFRNGQYSKFQAGNELEKQVPVLADALAETIAIPAPKAYVPHIYFLPLTKMKVVPKTLNQLAMIFQAIDQNPSLREQSATLKNALHEQIVILSNSPSVERLTTAQVLEMAIQQMVEDHGLPSAENISDFYNHLMVLLNRLTKLLESFSLQVEPDSPFERRLRAVQMRIIRSFSRKINPDDFTELESLIASRLADQLFNEFKKTGINMGKEQDTLQLFIDFLRDPRFAWRDHQGRNLYEVMIIFLRANKTYMLQNEKEAIQQIFDGLTAEIKGEYKKWKYSSPDYKSVLSDVIEMEARRHFSADIDTKKPFDELMGVTEQNTFYDYGRLMGLDGYDEIKERVRQVKQSWEDNDTLAVDDQLNASFADDFLILFNIGNYQQSTSCQSAVYGNNLNRGLAGYVSSGANKTVALVNQAGQVSMTRRIVRLKTIINERNEKEVVIFVEEKGQQFGSAHLDKIYAVLDRISENTGLRVAAASAQPLPDLVEEGAVKKNLRVIVYPGRTYDYSDYYGSQVNGGEQHIGLHRIVNSETVQRNNGFMVLRPAPQVLEKRFDLVIAHLRSNAADEKIADLSGRQDIHIVAIDNPEPGARTREGFTFVPAKIKYALPVPQKNGGSEADALNKYFEETFSGRSRANRKREIRQIDEAISQGDLELVVEQGGNIEAFEGFLDLYDQEIGSKERGRKPLFEAVEKAGGKTKFMNTRMGFYLKEKGRIVGGIIVKRESNHYVIGYAATDSEVRRRVRNMQFYLMVQVLKRSIEEGFSELSYGIDTNLYGHHLNTGLMQAKTAAGFIPHPNKANGDQLIKITHFGPFTFPLFFYNYGPEGQLESTLIAPDAMANELEQFEGITPKLNVYAFADGQITPSTIPEMKDRKAASERAEIRQTGAKASILNLPREVIAVVEQDRIDNLSPEMFKEIVEIAALNKGKLYLVIPDVLKGKYSERVAELRAVASVYYELPAFAISKNIPVVGFSDMEKDTLLKFQSRLDSGIAAQIKDSAFGLNQPGLFGVGILYALKDVPPDKLLPNANGFRYDQSGWYSAQILQDLHAYSVIVARSA